MIVFRWVSMASVVSLLVGLQVCASIFPMAEL
jgi:hypothetical protein